MRPHAVLGGVLAGTATVIVGTSVAVSSALTDEPFLAAQALRYGVAAVLLAAWGLARGRSMGRPDTRELALLTLVAASGLATFNVCLVLALRDAEPAAVGVVVGAVPLVLALVAPLAAGRVPSGALLVGAGIVVIGGALVQGFGETTLAAFGLSLGALAGEAGFTLFAVPVLPRLGALGVSVWSCALAVPMLAAASVLVDGADTWPRWHADVIGALVWLAVVVTAAAFVCWYAGVERLGAERAGLFAGLIPVSALLTGAVVGTSGIGAVAALGTVLVGIGITWGLRARDPAGVRYARPATHG